ncbi:ATP-binding cassette sub-family C member 4-like [Oppia nitens]|uniref:ATP-binding cassette sub-family C member 4-like n=1 Tax=Oppia nitens TaxID=1686743 RepID=UPI0023D99D70|nr:ATP-binding cassette sub-family C member 4-like [Oppia nitens]
MNEETLINKPSKYSRVNLFSKLHCTWLYPMFIRGLKRDVQMHDLYRCPQEDVCEKLVIKMEKNWRKELSKKSPSFARASIKTFIAYFIIPVILTLIGECAVINLNIIFLGQILQFFANPDKYDYFSTCMYAAAMVGAELVCISCIHPALFMGARVAIKIRVCWLTLMYKKALRLKHSAFSKTTIGQILNLMSNDVSRLDDHCQLVSYLVSGPINTAISVYICWQYIGWVSLIGLAILMSFIPFNSLMGRLFLKIRRKVASLSDTRIRFMNEIIKGMKVIKMYAWERHFDKLISDARKKEMKQIQKSILLKALNGSISTISPRVIIFVVLITHLVLGGKLTAETVFVTMSIFNELRFTMTFAFPQSIALTAELYVSCKRIQKYLLLEEIDQKSIENNDNSVQNGNNDAGGGGGEKVPLLTNDKQHRDVNNEDNDNTIVVENMSATWDTELKSPTITDITVSLAPGELLAVIGPVGSGKSSFLMSLLNEIQVTSGRVSVKGSVAYASQESWSFNSTVQQNITFGKPYEIKRFKEVISVCAMNRDLKMFPFGERSLVGERGVTLSGGQKARITLARALYNNADIYLLDDPLSAVDTEVANHIFEKCITGYLKSKSVILVTHQIQFIKKATKILVVSEGQPLAIGSYEQLMESGIDFMSLIKEDNKHENSSSGDNISKDQNQLTDEQQNTVIADQFRNRSISVLSSQSTQETDLCETDEKIAEENKAQGTVRAGVYWEYIRSGAGPVLLIVGLLSAIVSQVLQNYSDYWLSEWSNKEDSSIASKSDDNKVDETENIKIYSILLVTIFVSLILRSTTWFVMCIKASINLHNRIFYRLMRTRISFFDNNPVGRILNRFTKDVGTVDEQLPNVSYDLNIVF